jgi:hypothetical protein
MQRSLSKRTGARARRARIRQETPRRHAAGRAERLASRDCLSDCSGARRAPSTMLHVLATYQPASALLSKPTHGAQWHASQRTFDNAIRMLHHQHFSSAPTRHVLNLQHNAQHQSE